VPIIVVTAYSIELSSQLNLLSIHTTIKYTIINWKNPCKSVVRFDFHKKSALVIVSDTIHRYTIQVPSYLRDQALCNAVSCFNIIAKSHLLCVIAALILSWNKRPCRSDNMHASVVIIVICMYSQIIRTRFQSTTWLWAKLYKSTLFNFFVVLYNKMSLHLNKRSTIITIRNYSSTWLTSLKRFPWKYGIFREFYNNVNPLHNLQGEIDKSCSRRFIWFS
jgi:lysylphosphatidylglycerol synthetase-like protein (DUF2156 family)